MPELISIEEFIASKTHTSTLLDARSPREYEQGHIPGALNLPLLNNDERAAVGTVYKQEGHDAAVLKGFDLVGSKFAGYIRQANEISEGKEIALYCWRGGMRSSIMAWLLDKGRFKVTLIKGGYKSYRRWALKELETEKKIFVLGGMTGSGKTDLLLELKNQGEQVIDLEGLSNHKGSAFGALGQKPQSTIEQFENDLAWQWHQLDQNKITWLENESRSIGSVILPGVVYERMRMAPMIEVVLERNKRITKILNEYGGFPKEVLSVNTKKLEKRLGGLRLREALQHLQAGEMEDWAGILLDYYDQLYRFGIEQRNGSALYNIEVELNDINEVALKIIKKVYSLQSTVYS